MPDGTKLDATRPDVAKLDGAKLEALRTQTVQAEAVPTAGATKSQETPALATVLAPRRPFSSKPSVPVAVEGDEVSSEKTAAVRPEIDGEAPAPAPSVRVRERVSLLTLEEAAPRAKQSLSEASPQKAAVAPDRPPPPAGPDAPGPLAPAPEAPTGEGLAFAPPVAEAATEPRLDLAGVRTDEHVEGAAASEPTSARETASPRRALSAAWLRAVLDRPLRGHAPTAAWQSLQIRLDDGEGTLTIQTRRSDDGLVVAVGFSDAGLRGLASAGADRIQAVLQEHFGASVDLSLSGGGAGDAPPQDRADEQPLGPSFSSPAAASDSDAPAASPAPRRGSGHHEWVG